MKKQKLFFKIYFSILLILVPFALVSASYFTLNFRSFFYSRTQAELILFARTISGDISRNIFLSPDGNEKNAQQLSLHYGNISGFRITIISGDGRVTGDSAEDPGIMENHAGRPEVREAFSGRIGQNIRYSTTFGERMLYVALPLYNGQTIAACLRVAVAVTSLDRILAGLWIRIAAGTLIVLLAGGFLAFWMSGRITRPLGYLMSGADHYRQGDLEYRIRSSGILELDMLSQAMNSMAAELKQRIDMIIRQGFIENAIFSAMVEGIIALDTDRRIMLMNAAAGKMLGTSHENVRDKRFGDIILPNAFTEFILRSCDIDGVTEDVVLLFDRGESWFDVHGIPLHNADRDRFGTLIIIYDITKLKQTEKVRKDFAVNVSHEFKTPLTVIKGYVETLLNLHRNSSGDIPRFLDIINRESDRLSAIIDDLISLARIEQTGESDKIPFLNVKINDICTTAVRGLEEKIKRKGIRIDFDCPDDLSGFMNRGLMIQALLNLIDNAVKYSNDDSIVYVSARKTGDAVTIEVTDTGCGIPVEHHERIFERFYRVDKGRDRKTGGTGLGLALVKHIAMVHSGSVSVKSIPGKGSTFTLSIKQVQE